MDNKEFKALLARAKLSKKDFAAMVGIAQQSVNNWGSCGKDFPYWVRPFLENYIELLGFREMKEKMKQMGI